MKNIKITFYIVIVAIAVFSSLIGLLGILPDTALAQNGKAMAQIFASPVFGMNLIIIFTGLTTGYIFCVLLAKETAQV